MTTYPTIRKAFQNGTGDVFFANAERNQFLAVSRHDGTDFIKGFDLLQYSEVMELAEIQKPEPVKPVKAEEQKPVKMVDNSGAYSFYDEFPDAYGQYL